MKAIVKAHGNEYPVTFEVSKYYNGNLAICLTDYSEGYPSPFATITVNLGPLNDGERAFIDTNNCPWAEELITRLEIAFPTGIIKRSGYCQYPQYQFDLKEIEKYMEV